MRTKNQQSKASARKGQKRQNRAKKVQIKKQTRDAVAFKKKKWIENKREEEVMKIIESRTKEK